MSALCNFLLLRDQLNSLHLSTSFLCCERFSTLQKLFVKLGQKFYKTNFLYRGAKEEFDAAKRQLEDLEKIDNIDFGPDEEYYPLYRECFTLREEKYMYRLCLFDKTDQDGTSLGLFFIAY